MVRARTEEKKKFFIDLETSGLDPGPHVILQIGALTDDEADGTFSKTILPTNEQYMKRSPDAIKLNGLTWEVLQEKGEPFDQVKEEFIRWLDQANVCKGVIVGQNPDFDIRFLKYFMKGQLEYVGAPLHRPVDVRNMYSEAIRRRLITPKEEGRTGHIISRTIGVEEEPEVHDALEGALVVKRNYDKLKEILGKNGQQ